MTTPTTLARRAALVLLGVVLLSADASAQKLIPEGPGSAPARLSTEAAAATAAANSAECSLGQVDMDLNINNVRAKMYNIGGLFWRGGGPQYEVPYNPNSENPGPNSIFASGIWIAGLLDGNESNLRFAGATYSSWEFWPGPLDANGETNAGRCASFDKIWRVNFSDVEGYTANGQTPTINQDLLNWPIAQGAPYFQDTNGNDRRDPDEPRIELNLGDPGYSLTRGGGATLDLAAGFRPDIIGDQAVWWVMNDNGNTHGWSGAAPLEVEVRAHAFAFSTADALNNTTFYRYQFIYRGPSNLEGTYIALWSDPDLGNFGDDYVGSDPDLGLGFVYNGDSVDEGPGGYGALPPALGYDFFQGPLVGNGEGSGFNDGIDNNNNGEIDEEGERLQVETFFYFTNQGGPTGDPAASEDRGLVSYRLMQSQWKDGVPFTRGGDGYNPGSTDFVDFVFPADPPAFWSEYNANGLGRANLPDDRRFGVVTGPFTFKPGDVQEVVFGIVWAQAPQACQATATPQIASLQQLKFDDITVQGAFNADFNLPTPPPAVNVQATALDQEIVLQFDSVTGDNEDIFSYEVESPFATNDALDRTYNFEGFQIFQYRNAQDTEGTLIATYDLNNSVTTVIDDGLDCNTGAIINNVVAQGNNSGTAVNTPTSIVIQNDVFTGNELRNNTTYFFGVQPYAYNEFSSPNRIFAAPVTRVSVRPSLSAPRADGTVVQAASGDQLEVTRGETTVGEGVIQARVVDPSQITGDTYRVEFFSQVIGIDQHGTPDDPSDDTDILGTNYRIVNATTGEVILDGERYFNRTGMVLPQNTNVARVDGIAFDVQGPEPELSSLVEVIGGEITDTNLAFSLGSAPAPNRYFISANGASASRAGVLGRIDWQGGVAARAPIDYEIRFVENPDVNGQIVLNRQWDGEDPAEAFMTGWVEATGVTLADSDGDGDPDEIQYDGLTVRGGSEGRMPFQVWEIGPGGERQVTASIIDDTGDLLYSPSLGQLTYAFGNSDAVYERIYTRAHAYDEAAALADPLAYANAYFSQPSTVGRVLVVPFDGGAYVPQPGTTLRFVTTKPNLPNDVYTINTADTRAVTADAQTAEDALDLIAITPNPYRGASGYEASGDNRIARIVNLPAQATVRIFTLSGTLVRSLEKVDDGSTTIDWNLQTDAGLQIASGIYLIHVQARRSDGSVIGERVLKFGLVQRRVQLDVY
ncbi:hypothetical protein [Rubrivirga sp.]|uniref:hypothetical protein n=1 Tax=Rubrivirga sp. TaxID=1885344 RepID=UPI003B52EED9